MTILDDRERTEYLRSPYFKKHLYGDFTPFYITITICTIIFVVIFVLNVVLGCCSRHSRYWNDRHTGNRWLVSLWTATPAHQPPLDYTELNTDLLPKHYSEEYTISEVDIERGSPEYSKRASSAALIVSPKIESDI